MFEFSITNDSDSDFVINGQDRFGYNPSLHKSFIYIDKSVHISGLRYLDESEDYFENEQFLVLLCGSVFYRFKHQTDMHNVSAQSVCEDYVIKGNELFNLLKGNFVIVIIHKHKNDLLVVKDQLGLKYLYYKASKGFYYISTNLNDYKIGDYEFDKCALLEQLLFTYPLSNRCFINEVNMLPMGSFIEFEGDSLSVKEYYNVDDLFPDEQLIKFDINYFADLFRSSVLMRASVSPRPNVSLTGGFDGRTNVSVLLRDKRDFFMYSFGRRGGENTEVPMKVSQKLDVSYEPIYLDNEYERHYADCALQALFYSDGISRLERANYTYSLQILAQKSRVNVTGLLAEAYSPVHLKNDYINELYYDAVYQGLKLDYESELAKTGITPFLDKEAFDRSDFDKLEADIEVQKLQYVAWRQAKYQWVAYLKDLISTGFIRFYGIQMHLERYFCENLTTFYDIDLLEYLYSTDHLKLYANAFRKSPVFRINNRKIQSYIIMKNYPPLAYINVDRGYPPAFNLGFAKCLIPLAFYKREILRNRRGNIGDFDTPNWVRHLIDKLIDIPDVSSLDFVNAVNLTKWMENYSSVAYNASITRLIGLSLWTSSDRNHPPQI